MAKNRGFRRQGEERLEKELGLDKAVDEPESDIAFDKDAEGDTPDAYNTDAAKEAGEAITGGQEENPEFEAAPEGTAGMVDAERAERADAVKNDPLRGYSAVERAQIAQFGRVNSGEHAGAVAPIQASGESELIKSLLKMIRGETPQPAGDVMGLDIGGEGSPTVEETIGEYFLIASHGGIWQIFTFTNLNTVQGFTQRLPGLKRLFKRVMGETKLQEINGQGKEVLR